MKKIPKKEKGGSKTYVLEIKRRLIGSYYEQSKTNILTA